MSKQTQGGWRKVDLSLKRRIQGRVREAEEKREKGKLFLTFAGGLPGNVLFKSDFLCSMHVLVPVL